MPDLILDGCRSEPLASYLKAVGVFRLVAEQLDPSATARWESDRLVVGTDRSLEDLLGFFLDTYRPTPVVSPWNGGSGFHPKDNTDGITAIESSSPKRLEPYRVALEATRSLVADDDWASLPKEQQVTWCRNVLPDEARLWIDAAVVLAESGPVFPPILGSGGNVGRLDFSNNFMQRVADVLAIRSGRGVPSRSDSETWLRGAVNGGDAGKLLAKAVGQFDPGAAGGTNAPAGGPEASLVNPWDFVLTIEGALLFASGAARRMQAGARGKAAMPFTFEITAVGDASAADGEGARGELWAPLWSRPARLPELRRLFAEGRMEWRGGQARRGVDAVRAATSLGVDRGITGFVRHLFVERMGQSMLAVPVAQVSIEDGAREDVAILGELDEWAELVRRAPNLPASAASVLRRLDAAMFSVTDRRDPRALQEVLMAAADLELVVARSRSLRESVPRPLGGPLRRQVAGSPQGSLDASRWIPLLQDNTAEFRLAVAVASCRDAPPPPGSAASDDRRDRPATLLRAVSRSANGRDEWRSDGRPVVPGLGVVGPVELLGAMVRRRAIDGETRSPGDEPTGPSIVEGPRGIDPAFTWATSAYLSDVRRFLRGDLDAHRFARLVAALLLLRFREWTAVAPPAGEDGKDGVVLGGAAALVLPFFHGRSIDVLDRLAPRGSELRFHRAGVQVRLWPASSWPSLLAAGRVEDVIRDAVHRLRVAQLEPLLQDARSIAEGVDGPRLLAAAAFRLRSNDVARLLACVAGLPSDHRPVVDDDPQGET